MPLLMPVISVSPACSNLREERRLTSVVHE